MVVNSVQLTLARPVSMPSRPPSPPPLQHTQPQHPPIRPARPSPPRPAQAPSTCKQPKKPYEASLHLFSHKKFSRSPLEAVRVTSPVCDKVAPPIPVRPAQLQRSAVTPPPPRPGKLSSVHRASSQSLPDYVQYGARRQSHEIGGAGEDATLSTLEKRFRRKFMPLCLAPDIFSDCEKTYPSRMQECSPPLRRIEKTVTMTKPDEESMKRNCAYSGAKKSSPPQSVSRKPSVETSSLLHKNAPPSPPPLPEPPFCSEVRSRNIPKCGITVLGIPPPPPLPATPQLSLCNSPVQEDISREISDRVEACVSVKKMAEKLSLIYCTSTLANATKPPVPDKKPVLSVLKAPPGEKMPALRLRSPSNKADTGTSSTSRPAPAAPPRTSSLANTSQESPTLGQSSQPISPSVSCLSRGQSFRVAPPPPPACVERATSGRERTTSTESAQFARKFSFRAAPPPPPPVKQNLVSSNTELGSPSNMLMC